MKKAEPLCFGALELADAVDRPPVLFHGMFAPCACARPLTNHRYVFFPSAVFIYGDCDVCGPERTAIFAPEAYMEARPAAPSLRDMMIEYLKEIPEDMAQDVLQDRLKHSSSATTGAAILPPVL